MDALTNRIADVLSRGWWHLLLRGTAALIFALIAWFRPGISLASLVILFGAYAFVDGVLSTGNALLVRKEYSQWWVLLIGGLIGIGVGLLTFLVPGITALAIVFYIAVWAIAHGAFEIVTAIWLRKELRNEWLLVVAGIGTVALGVLLMANPAVGALTVLWLIAGYAFVFGVLMIAFAFKARRFGRRLAAM